MFGKNKIKIRTAKIEDIPQILEVEKVTWGEGGAATKEVFESRIKIFPEGTLIALVEKKIVGVVATQIIDYNGNPKNLYEMTDNGCITKTHNPKGDTIYGVDLSVHPLYQNKGVGKKLLESIGKLVVRYNLKQCMLGGRVPYYYKFADEIKIEDYVNIEKQKGGNSIPPDPELSFYRKFGLRVAKIIPDYFKDPDSLNYGVLLIRKNPFYNKWYRWIVVLIFTLIIDKILKS